MVIPTIKYIDKNIDKNAGSVENNDDVQMFDMSLFFSPMLGDLGATAVAATATTATTTTTATAAVTATTSELIESMDLSTLQRFNKRSRDKSSPNDESKIAKFMGNESDNEEEEGNEDLFNNESMENPTKDND